MARVRPRPRRLICYIRILQILEAHNTRTTLGNNKEVVKVPYFCRWSVSVFSLFGSFFEMHGLSRSRVCNDDLTTHSLEPVNPEYHFSAAFQAMPSHLQLIKSQYDAWERAEVGALPIL
jgi:hypothetical protein